MIDDFLESLAHAGQLADAGAANRIWALTEAFFASNGFDRLIYIDAQPDTATILTTLPAEWMVHYREQDYARIDPFFSYCCTTFRPISTGVAYAHTHVGLTAAQQGLIREASDFGLNAGFSSAIRLAGPRGVAGWNIGSSFSRAEVDALRADREAELRLAARHAHDWLASLHAANAAARLSSREFQCLSLLADGLRNKDISRILGLSAAAVELYQRNARRKLGAATREQAIAIATANGLLSP